MRIAPMEVLAASAVAVCCLALAIHVRSNRAPAPAEVTAAPRPQPPTARPRIEVVFVLDTTGSMSGLLEGAKQKIWALANRLADGEPRPELRIGLVAYRDLGDAYVTRRFDFTGDLDAVYAELLDYQADGGGDTPEHVGQGLHDALHAMQWTRGEGVLRLVFLVGDAPPHAESVAPDPYALADLASARGIVINTVRCGGDPDTEAAWRRISARTGGEYTSIAQDGGVVAVDTPFDQRLSELNHEVARTVLGWGSLADKQSAQRKLDNRIHMSAQSAAEAASYSAKAARMNDEDLVDALAGGRSLAEIPTDELPDEMQSMSERERAAHVARARERRSALNAEILELSRQRAAYLRDAEEAAGVDQGFDGQVLQALKRQASRVGVAY